MLEYPSIRVEAKVDGFRAYLQRAFGGFEPELKRAADEAIDEAIKHLDFRELAKEAAQNIVKSAFERLKWDHGLNEALQVELKAALLRSLRSGDKEDGGN